MPKIRCDCGARFTFAEKSLGKKAKCARCGEILTLQPDNEDSGIISIAEEPDYGGVAPDDSGQPTFDTPAPPAHFPTEVIVDPPETERPADFVSKLLDTVLFVKEPHNFVIYLIVTFLICLAEIVLPVGGIFGTIGQFIIFGWYCAFRFGIIGNAATGNEKIPTVGSTEGTMEGIVLPAVGWIGSWIVVLAPATIVAFVTAGTGLRQVFANFVPGTGIIDTMRAMQNAGHGVTVVTLALGLFFWPIVVLCVSFGGFSSLLRFDLILKTVLATLPSYLFTVAVVYGGTVATFTLASVLPASIVGAMAIVSASVYLEIVAMRTIGLHYYFFKERYAWSWG